MNPEEEPRRDSENKPFRIAFAVAAGLFLLAVLGLGIAFLVSPGSDEGRVDDREVDRALTHRDMTPGAGTDQLQVAEYELDVNAGLLRGSVMNHGSTSQINVEVTFTLYDEQQSEVGTAFERVGEIQGGDTWRFNIPVEEGATSAELRSLTSTPRGGVAPGQDHRPGDTRAPDTAIQ
jgi:hypothetical protein